MTQLIKPRLLKEGDTVATVSLSWGGAGEFKNRYEIGKKQLQETFGLRVVETKNALKSAEYIAKNPKARADDLMEAFSVTHFACYKAGLTSFYGTSLLVGFAENGGMHHYQVNDIRRTLFSPKPPGRILPNASGWTSEFIDWNDVSRQNTKRQLTKSRTWKFLQGKGITQGQLVGGCVEVLEFLKGTDLWLSPSEWINKILFLETSEEMMTPGMFKRILRNYAAQGVFEKISGLILGRPYDNKFVDEYNEVLLQVIHWEQDNSQLPIVTEMDFGHTCPTFSIPYGVLAEIDSEQKTFSILESGVTD